MKTDELLYELMEEVNDTEVMMLDCDSEVSMETLDRQTQLALNKIHIQMPKKSVSFRRKRLMVLVAAAVMLFGMVTFAKENSWDVAMAEMLGLSGVMEKLDGGYVRIDEFDRQGDIEVTAVQSIGDRNSQWIQFDTNIPWAVGDEGYYMFDECDFKFARKSGSIISGGSEFYSFNNNGTVSFMLYAVGVEKINRANVKVRLENLYEYENVEAEGKLLSEGCWNLAWTNYYAPNTITKYPLVVVDDFWIQKIEITPISMYVEAFAPRSKEARDFVVEQVKLKDGTVVLCREQTGGISNRMFYERFVVYEDWNRVNIEEIESVKINGKEIAID